MFGEDFLVYMHDKRKGTLVAPDTLDVLITYNHQRWEQDYDNSDHWFTPIRNNKGIPQKEQTREQTPAHKPKQQPVVNPVPKCSTTDKQPPAYQPKQQPIAKQIHVPKCASTQNQTPAYQPNQPPVVKTKAHTDHLKAMLATAKTRSDIATVDSHIPPVNYSAAVSITVQVVTQPQDPFSLIQRPCDIVIRKAESLLNGKRGNGGVNLGVHIGGFGQFTEDGLSDLIKFIGISKTARMVAEERQWLQQFNFINNEDELEELTEALWHKPTNGIIIREGKKSIDVMSYSDIVSERHIDNFVVDISIEKYLQEVNGNDALYLPSELYDWMKSNSTKFKTVNLKKRVLGRKNVCDINVIIAPVHMNDHWGLVVIDIHNEKLMFDDGMKVYPPTTTLQNIKDALDILCVAFPSWQSLQSRFWTSCMNFDRFGMPSQVSSSPGNYTGTGICGIGIILAARDFIDNGPSAANNIKWKYSEMNYHRLNLMKQILKWQKYQMNITYVCTFNYRIHE